MKDTVAGTGLSKLTTEIATSAPSDAPEIAEIEELVPRIELLPELRTTLDVARPTHSVGVYV